MVADPRTVVLLPPIGLDAESWSLVDLQSLSTRRYEYPGHGQRPASDLPGWTLDTLADDLIASTSGPVHLVGVSMGSIVAQHAAIRHPAKVASLVLAGAGAANPADVMTDRAEQVRRDGIAAVAAPTLRRWFSDDALDDPTNTGVAIARRCLATVDPDSFAHAWDAMAAHDVRDQLAALDLPVTCVAATGDRSAPVSVVRALADAIPGAVVRELDGPHMIQLEQPERFASAVREHLQVVVA